MIFKRNYSPEIMDDFSINDDRIEFALKELRIINKFLGGNSTSKRGIKKIIGEIKKKEIKILDVGSGASDILHSINTKNKYRIFSVDRNLRACIFAAREYPHSNVICADACSLPFHNESFDIVHASLFLHHFREEEIVWLIKFFLSISKYGIVINDLRRSVFAYYGIKLLTFFFSKNEFVKYDGPLSVKRGFIKSDWEKIFLGLKVENILIKKKWAFRWLIIIRSTDF